MNAFSASFGRIAELVKKEFLQLRRDPRLWRVLLVAPMIQLVIFGYAVSTDVRHTALLVVDHDRSAASRALAAAMTAGGSFDLVAVSDRAADAVAALDRGEAVVALIVPAGYAADLAAHRATVQILVDGTNSNLATLAMGHAQGILAMHGGAAVGAAPGRGPAPGVSLVERAWYNPDLDSRNYNVPAVVGTLMMLVCLLLTSLAIVRERELGTLEQLMVSPLRPAELIAGKVLPFALIGLVDLALVSTLAVVWFRVPLVGSVSLLVGATMLFLLSGLGLGLLISTVSATQQEAFMASFLTFMPTILLSGFMFPVSSMPPVFQWATLANPLRHYLEIVRAIFLKGAGTAELGPQLGALAVLGTAILAFAASRFKKRIG